MIITTKFTSKSSINRLCFVYREVRIWRWLQSLYHHVTTCCVMNSRRETNTNYCIRHELALNSTCIMYNGPVIVTIVRNNEASMLELGLERYKKKNVQLLEESNLRSYHMVGY